MKAPAPKEPEEAEEEEELEPLWFDDGQREAPAAPEEDASDDDASDGGDAPSAFFVDSAADEGADAAGVDFLGKQEELEPGAYFGAVAPRVAAAKLEIGGAAADRESRYVDFDALEIRGDALAAAGTADAALARARRVPAGPKRRPSPTGAAPRPRPGLVRHGAQRDGRSELDAKALAFRGVTDPKRFCKKHDAAVAVRADHRVAGAFEGRGQTLRRRDRKTSLMGAASATTKRAYAKRKFTQIQDKALARKRLPHEARERAAIPA
ncbi:hypothetical protein JL721_5254 [Aureococcus anophagefferens]|nr:hypothetical protein JL721_5254 [Aureococcus anophagefferens]